MEEARSPRNGAVDWHESIADSFARGYDRSPRFRERLVVWRDLIARYVSPGDAVLDAGCGAGTFAFEAAARGVRVTAFDGSPAMIELCERRLASDPSADIDFSVALLDSLSDHPAGHYDTVMCSSVLEYQPHLNDELAKLARVVKPGGRLIVSMPNRASFYRWIERMAFRVSGRPRYYAHIHSVVTASQFRQYIERHEMVSAETRYYADPPLALVSALSFGEERRKTLFAMVAVKNGPVQAGEDIPSPV